jgi:hypothetical protein
MGGLFVGFFNEVDFRPADYLLYVGLILTRVSVPDLPTARQTISLTARGMPG